ncbi:hypothetical protein C1646_760590 [Rhizophagus diaphanus]|nr:hypothetical protein C1646_760590 [Rhizophagus diaphanus] [Rhizophagus sp. MUCL 43196]
MFHSDYKHIIDKLPESLVKRACERLLHHSKDPVPLESISRKRRKNMAQEKLLHPQSWPECNVSLTLPTIHVTDNGTQTINITCDHEEENNRQVMNELKVFRQHLLDYNKRTFEKFMQNIEREYREQISTNKKLRFKNKDLKMQLQEAEKKLTSMKSDSIH